MSTEYSCSNAVITTEYSRVVDEHCSWCDWQMVSSSVVYFLNDVFIFLVCKMSASANISQSQGDIFSLLVLSQTQNIFNDIKPSKI